MSLSGPLSLAGATILLVALVAPLLGDHSITQAPEPAPSIPVQAAPSGIRPAQEIRRDPDGQFYVLGEVNGVPVRFLVDTGASFVALTPEDARRAGIADTGERKVAMSPGGQIEIRPVTVQRVAVGSLVESDVRGGVIEKLPVSLLGQSYLSRIARVEIEGDRMILH